MSIWRSDKIDKSSVFEIVLDDLCVYQKCLHKQIHHQFYQAMWITK